MLAVRKFYLLTPNAVRINFESRTQNQIERKPFKSREYLTQTAVLPVPQVAWVFPLLHPQPLHPLKPPVAWTSAPFPGHLWLGRPKSCMIMMPLTRTSCRYSLMRSVAVCAWTGSFVTHCGLTLTLSLLTVPGPKFIIFPTLQTGENKQHHSRVLVNSFLVNGHTLGFCP